MRKRSAWLIAALCAACAPSSGGGVDLAARDLPLTVEGVAFPDGGARERAVVDLQPSASDRILVGDLPQPLPSLSLYVNLGDSLGAGYNASSGHSYKALLVQNDSLLYPAYQGRDLKSRFPAIAVLDRAKSGATTTDVVAQALGVAGNPAGATLVVISAGGNDFNDNTLVMIDPVQAAAAAKKATDNLKKIVDHVSNKVSFPGGVVVAMLNVHDPTDGHGSIPARPNLSGFCSTILKLGVLVGPIVVQNLASFNGAYAAFAGANKLRPVDNHAAFLGHGFHFDDKSSPSYQPTDPTLWFANDCAHGNDRGHHELRRLIWKALTGEQ